MDKTAQEIIAEMERMPLTGVVSLKGEYVRMVVEYVRGLESPRP